MTCRNSGQKPWSFRRKLVVMALLFCAVCAAYVTVFGHPSEDIGGSIVNSSFGLAGAVIGSYVFGAVWHDKN